MKQGFFDLKNKAVFLPNSFADQYSRFLLSEGDLIISMTGTTGKEDYGNVCKVSVDKSFLLNQRVGKFIKKSDITDNQFFYHLMQTEFFRSQLFSNSSGGVRQANISGDAIKRIKVPCPDIAVQSEIAVGIDEHLTVVEGNSSLISFFEHKIQDRISKVWGE